MINLLWIVSSSGMCSAVVAVTSTDVRYGQFKRSPGSPATWVPGGRLAECAVYCVHDDRCVAIGVDGDCIGFREMPKISTRVWARISGAESEEPLIAENCRIPPQARQDIGQRSKTFFLLASNRSRTLTLLEGHSGRIDAWTLDMPPSGNTFTGDIAGISAGEMFLYYNTKSAIYRGKIFQTHVERMVTNAATVGGFVVNRDSAFFSAGRMIIKMDLTDPKYKTTILATIPVKAVPLYQDYIEGRCIIFWPDRRNNKIQRLHCKNTKRKMMFLVATSGRRPWNLLSMTIDVHNHVIFTLSALGDICRHDDISSRYPNQQMKRVVRLPYPAVLGQTLMYHGDKVYIFTPNNKNIDAMDLKLRVFIRDMVIGDCLDCPPAAITIVK